MFNKPNPLIIFFKNRDPRSVMVMKTGYFFSNRSKISLSVKIGNGDDNCLKKEIILGTNSFNRPAGWIETLESAVRFFKTTKHKHPNIKNINWLKIDFKEYFSRSLYWIKKNIKQWS